MQELPVGNRRELLTARCEKMLRSDLDVGMQVPLLRTLSSRARTRTLGRGE